MMDMTSCFKLIRKGASCFFLSDSNKNMPNLPYIKVDNVLHALEKIAKTLEKKIKLDS